ncbi:MAG: T9SS type A sorting domain-containing protein [Candidatus Latescibacteria bacterium]|nr:T9SS type A sorting domain-containing protein [Candidatus Latescibacterota bacterium]
MKNLFLSGIIFMITLLNVYAWDKTSPLIIDHTCTDLALIPESSIEDAKTNLHIAYGHTSHGSQLTTGMSGLVSFKGELYAFNNGGANGSLDLRDKPFSGVEDLGNPDRTSWETATRNYLKDHPDINVVIWSWCGQAGTARESDIDTYLSLMNGLETDYSDVDFVYMTGHLDGKGLEGNLHIRNEQIRNYCRENNKILYDFEDIESYDPDGTYFGDKIPTDNCDYDSDGNGSRDGNWAIEWQNAHPGEWYNCSSAHSQPLNANRKAYAAWWLWAKLAEWGNTSIDEDDAEAVPQGFTLQQNFPNPFNSATTITYALNDQSMIDLAIFNIAGQRVKTLVYEIKPQGFHSILWHGLNDQGKTVTSGIYICRLKIPDGLLETKNLLYIK